MLSRDQILAANDLPSEDVPVPEWDGSVRVRGLTASERDEFEATILAFRAGSADPSINLRNARSTLAVRCIVDDAGERIFKDADIAALGKKSAVAVERVCEVAMRLSGLSEADVEELVEGFDPAQAGASSTA